MEIAGLSGRKRADEPADWDSVDERLKLRIGGFGGVPQPGAS